jgi:hypothetical protein
MLPCECMEVTSGWIIYRRRKLGIRMRVWLIRKKENTLSDSYQVPRLRLGRYMSHGFSPAALEVAYAELVALDAL